MTLFSFPPRDRRHGHLYFLRLTMALFLPMFGLSAPAAATEPAGQKPLVINTSYSPPYSSSEADGILDRLLVEAFGRLGRQVICRMLPAERSFQDANAGVADGDVGRIRGVEALYPNLVIVDEPIIENRDFVAFSVQHDFPTTDWKTLLPYNLGFVHGWKIFEAPTKDARSATRAQNTEALFRMLGHDRIDLALSARLDGLAMARKIGLEGVRVLEPPLARLKMYLYLHKRHAELANAAAAALSAMKTDGSFQRIRQSTIDRWLSAK